MGADNRMRVCVCCLRSSFSIYHEVIATVSAARAAGARRITFHLGAPHFHLLTVNKHVSKTKMRLHLADGGEQREESARARRQTACGRGGGMRVPERETRDVNPTADKWSLADVRLTPARSPSRH